MGEVSAAAVHAISIAISKRPVSRQAACQKNVTERGLPGVTRMGRLDFSYPILKFAALSEDLGTPAMSSEPAVPSASRLPPEPSLVSAASACEAVA